MKIKQGDIIQLSDGRSVLVAFDPRRLMGISQDTSLCQFCCLHKVDKEVNGYCFISSLLKGGCVNNIPTDCVLLEVTDVETGREVDAERW